MTKKKIKKSTKTVKKEVIKPKPVITKINDYLCFDSSVKPKPPSIKCITGSGDICKCGSSFRYKWFFFNTYQCINPQCCNYYQDFPGSDLNSDMAIFVNGKWIYQWRWI